MQASTVSHPETPPDNAEQSCVSAEQFAPMQLAHGEALMIVHVSLQLPSLSWVGGSHCSGGVTKPSPQTGGRATQFALQVAVFGGSHVSGDVIRPSPHEPARPWQLASHVAVLGGSQVSPRLAWTIPSPHVPVLLMFWQLELHRPA
jgi:hypothetical protein